MMRTRKRIFLLGLLVFLLSQNFLGNSRTYATNPEAGETEEKENSSLDLLKDCFKYYDYSPQLEKTRSLLEGEQDPSEGEERAIAANLSKLKKAATFWLKGLEESPLIGKQEQKRFEQTKEALDRFEYGYRLPQTSNFSRDPEVSKLFLTRHYPLPQRSAPPYDRAFFAQGQVVLSHLIQWLSELLLAKVYLEEESYEGLEKEFQVLAERELELKSVLWALMAHDWSEWSLVRNSVDLSGLENEVSSHLSFHHRKMQVLLPDRIWERVRKGFQLLSPVWRAYSGVHFSLTEMDQLMAASESKDSEKAPLSEVLASLTLTSLLREGTWILTGEKIIDHLIENSASQVELQVWKEKREAQDWKEIQSFFLFIQSLLSQAFLPPQPALPSSLFLPGVTLELRRLIPSLGVPRDAERKEKFWETCEAVYESRPRKGEDLFEGEFEDDHQSLKKEAVKRLGISSEEDLKILEEILSSFYQSSEFWSHLLIGAQLPEMRKKVGQRTWMTMLFG